MQSVRERQTYSALFQFPGTGGLPSLPIGQLTVQKPSFIANSSQKKTEVTQKPRSTTLCNHFWEFMVLMSMVVLPMQKYTTKRASGSCVS